MKEGHLPSEIKIPRLLTIRDVSARLAISVDKVRELMEDGTLPVIRLGERLCRFRESDIATLIEQKLRESS